MKRYSSRSFVALCVALARYQKAAAFSNIPSKMKIHSRISMTATEIPMFGNNEDLPSHSSMDLALPEKLQPTVSKSRASIIVSLVSSKQIIPNLQCLFVRLQSIMRSSFKGAAVAIRQSWWCFPMIAVSALPIYSLLFLQEFARMPSFWEFKDMSHLKTMPVLVSGFLASNIFYILSGLYLMDCIPNRSKKSSHTARTPLLGAMVFASGVVSLLYHAFQSLGGLNVAESLCFIDHGVAFSSACYFLAKCGMPSIKTLSIGVPSLLLLLFPGDSYPVIHSIWHAMSAGTTISWAFDGVDRRQRFISKTLQARKDITM